MAKRRGRGEGTIVQRADGRWMASVDLGWQDGKRRRKAYYGATRAAVAAKLTKSLRAVQQGATSLGDERQTIKQFLERWIVSVQPSVRAKTHHSYAQLVRLHLVPGLGHLRLCRLQPEDVDAFLDQKREAGLSPRTCQYLRSVLRVALNRAIKRKLVTQNAAALADAPRVVRAEVQSLTPDQARTFLAAIADHHLYALIVVAVSCGLREGELLGLQWPDLDLDRGVLRVRHALERLGKGWRLIEPKSEGSRRTIRLPAPVVPILRAHRVAQLERRLAAGARWRDHGFVFTTRDGQPLDGCRLNRQTKAQLKAAGLPQLKFHSLRHSCATFLLVQGVAPRVVMDILGHSQISLTMDTYSHVIEQLQDGAAQEMSTLLWADQKKGVS
jgi:integrase